MTVNEFCKKYGLSESQCCGLCFAISEKVKQGMLQRKKNEKRVFEYNEKDLVEVYTEKGMDTPSEGYITISSFYTKHPHLKEKRGLTTAASHAFLTGQITRESVNSSKTRFAYKEDDLLMLVGNAKPPTSEQNPNKKVYVKTSFEYKPGVFVRFWRWLFGYRKETIL